MNRESRQQLAQQYVATRDAYLSAHYGADKVFRGGVPSYMAEVMPAKTGEDLFRDFAHLIKPREH